MRRTGPERGIDWFEHPGGQTRINRKITGREISERYHHFVHEDRSGRVPVERALTLGCGGGDLERGLAQYSFCRRHDALDVSEGAIQKARALSEEQGLTHIRYRVSDVNKASLDENAYDAVLGISSIHHIAEIESVYENVYRAPKPDGCFYMDEFVGPSQFQWSDTQLEAVNDILRRIPERLRVRRSDGTTVRHAVVRPTIDQMNAVDPYEAIRSGEIIPLLSEYFPDVTLRGYGGNILHLLLEDITGNFVETDAEAREWLERIFDYEDEWLLKEGVGDNFSAIVARKPLK